MKKIELVAQLEAAKSLSTQVDIDKVIALINAIEPEVKEVKTVGITEETFEKIIEKVSDALSNVRTSNAVDFDSAQFCINYNNQVELEDVDLDRDYIENEIREELESLIEEPEREYDEDGFIEAQNEVADEGRTVIE